MRQLRAKTSLLGLRNIGPTIAARLAEVGIKTVGDLRSIGPARAYRRMKAANPGTVLPVCYNLYSLQGALQGVHWDALPAATKRELRQQAGVSEPAPRRRRLVLSTLK